MAERTINNVADTEDPQVELTFNTEDGDVKLTITVSIDGDARKVWTDLAEFTERGALHYVAAQIFEEITRDA